MLREAQEGDVLFGTFHAGPNDGFVHFRFDGQGRDVLSGITFSDDKGNSIAYSLLNEVNLLDIFDGESSINYHGSNPSFEWGGLFRYNSSAGMPSLPYLRESTSSETYFTSEQVKWDNRFKGIIGSFAGMYVGYFVCGGGYLCGFGGPFFGQASGEVMWFDWDKYGRQINDQYLTVSGYNFTFRYYPNEGNKLIYYSGQGTGVMPVLIR